MSWAHINRNAVSPWTPEMQERVLTLARDGLSAATIGRAVELTKNQIIGWCSRHHPGVLKYRRPPPQDPPPQANGVPVE